MIATVFLFWGVAAPAAESPFARSSRLLGEGKIEDARREAARQLAENPQDAFGLSLMGVILDQLGRFEEADTHYMAALRDQPNSAVVLNNIGSHYMSWKKSGMARTYFLRVLEQQPQHFNANYQLARIALKENNPSRAQLFLNHLRREDRDAKEVVILMAETLFALKRSAEARKFLTALRKAWPGDPAVAFSTGTVYYKNRLYSDAKESFQDAVRLAPSDYEAEYNLGLACYRVHDPQAAEQAFANAWRLKPGSADPPYYLAVIHSEKNDDDEAVRLLLASRRLANQKPELLLLLGHELLKVQFYADAAEALEQYSELVPGRAEALKLLGLAYAGAGNWHAAVVNFTRYLEKEPLDTDSYLERARARLRNGEIRSAEEDLRRYLNLKPRSAEACLELGILELERKQPGNAAPLLERATGASGMSRAHYYLALVYRQLNRDSDATRQLELWQEAIGRSSRVEAQNRQTRYIKYLKKALELQPANVSLKERLCSTLLEYGNVAEAVSELKFAVSADGSDRLRTMLARAYIRAKQYSEAAEVINKLSHISGPSSELANLQAHISYEQGNYQHALEEYQQAIRLAPQNENDYLDLIIFFIDTHAHEAARKAVESARQIFPRSRKLALVDAMEQAIDGDPRKADAILRDIRKHWPVDSLHATISGLVASSLDDLGSAVAYMQEAIALGTDDAMPYYYLGLFEMQRENPNMDTILKWIDLALGKDPQHADSHLFRGKLLLKVGKTDEAVASLEQAVRLNPSAESYYVLSRAYARAGNQLRAEQTIKESERVRQQKLVQAQGAPQRQLLVRIQTAP